MTKKDDMSIMLGMLVELGLLEVTKNGAYITTQKGQEALAEYVSQDLHIFTAYEIMQKETFSWPKTL